jgi:hypothetical protein
MKQMLKITVVVAAWALVAGNAQAAMPVRKTLALSWKVYVDKNYGYSIPVPANLALLPWTGDPVSAWQIRSRTFESQDGKVSLSIVTHFTLDRPLQDFYNFEFANRLNGGDGINYWILKKNWYVISGTNALGFEYYSKTVVFKDQGSGSQRYIHYDFVYPASQRATYDAAATKIARKFVPNLPGLYERS